MTTAREFPLLHFIAAIDPTEGRASAPENAAPSPHPAALRLLNRFTCAPRVPVRPPQMPSAPLNDGQRIAHSPTFCAVGYAAQRPTPNAHPQQTRSTAHDDPLDPALAALNM